MRASQIAVRILTNKFRRFPAVFSLCPSCGRLGARSEHCPITPVMFPSRRGDMYTAINWALTWDFTLRSARSRVRCGSCIAVAGIPLVPPQPVTLPWRKLGPQAEVVAHLTVERALRSSRRSAHGCPPAAREEPRHPDDGGIPLIAAPASSMWRLPRALPLAWFLCVAGLPDFHAAACPSDPVAACWRDHPLG